MSNSRWPFVWLFPSHSSSLPFSDSPQSPFVVLIPLSSGSYATPWTDGLPCHHLMVRFIRLFFPHTSALSFAISPLSPLLALIPPSSSFLWYTMDCHVTKSQSHRSTLLVLSLALPFLISLWSPPFPLALIPSSSSSYNTPRPATSPCHSWRYPLTSSLLCWWHPDGWWQYHVCPLVSTFLPHPQYFHC